MFFFHRFGLSQKLCVWKEILLKDLSYKNLDIHTIIFDVDIITAADHETKIRSALLICGKSRFFVRCCTNPLSLRSNEDWYGGTWIHWWFGQASSLMRYWIVGSAPIPKWFEMCWPEMNSKISKLKNILKLVISYSALIECERSDVLLLSIIASKLENDSGTFDSVRFGFWQV